MTGNRGMMRPFSQLRRAMVDSQLRTYDVNQPRLVAAMETVERERFLPVERRAVAYADQAVAVSPARRMPTPMVFARMVQALDLAPGEQALDVACGLGYSSAVLAAMGARVVALEDDAALAAAASERLRGALGAGVVPVRVGPLPLGAPYDAPFDAILVGGALNAAPAGLFAQLRDGGRLVCVMGEGRSGRITLFRRTGAHVSDATVLEAAAPALPAFDPEPGFVF
jgi:protein-L-isoaspartate(D-aspartate) O-methyltransferase